jgi:hypothetical protein
VKVVNDGAIVGDIYLSDEVIEDMADKLMKYANEEDEEYTRRKEADVSQVKYISPFPANCPIDPKHTAIGPTMNLNGDVRMTEVYRYCDDEDINVVPNGIIHDGEFISVHQLANATILGTNLCKLYKKETGNPIPDFKD